MEYNEAVKYLYSFTNFELEPAKRYAPELYDRGRVIQLLAELGDPHHRFASVHVAGSKGKGSTAALIANVLQAAGYRTGLYTSPHLFSFRERVQINRQLIGEDRVAELVGGMRPAVEQIPGITTFELITALGYLHFARAGVEIAVVEVGMGGRLDATNVLAPQVTAITALSLEHTTFLGNTLAEIAAEKAGIVKPGVPLVIAPQRPEADAVIADVCRQRGARMVRSSDLWKTQVLRRSEAGSLFDLKPVAGGEEWNRFGRIVLAAGPFRLPLPGDHQIENALVALAVVGLLRPRGFPVAAPAIGEGIATVRWPGRLEVLSREPLVVADGAHNPASARALVASLRDYFKPRHIRLVYGSLVDKDAEGVLRVLLPAVEDVVIVAPRLPRAMPVDEIATVVRRLGCQPAVAPSVAEGVCMATERTDPGDLVCVTGSLFVVGEAGASKRRGLDAPEQRPTHWPDGQPRSGQGGTGNDEKQ